MHSNLWAPWRMAYLRDLERRAELAGAATPPPPTPVNFIAAYFETPADDETNFVVHRNEHGLVMLNRYPYANGHLLAALGQPRPSLHDYDDAQRREFWKLVDIAMDMVEQLLRPQGMNVGINVGRAAGAGLPEHVHAHVVPRWTGDTNFLSVVGEVRLIPEELEEMASKFRQWLASSSKRG